jgi:hypothetical protein
MGVELEVMFAGPRCDTQRGYQGAGEELEQGAQ